MSGIAGIVRLDGGQVDERTLRSLAHSLSFRGPDRQHVWINGCVGLAHTLLRTSEDEESHPQPATLDGSVWITADVRIDGRSELVRNLESCGRAPVQIADDALLVLHAYHAWGEQCVDRLLGDFSFAIWDGRRRRLFCARDHFGVKPFYFARTADGFVFGSNLDSLRVVPGVSSALNELAVADFLLFGINQEPTTTVFADIHRLAPAHTLTFTDCGAQTKKYWSVPSDGRVRYRQSTEYVEHFSELLRAAVADRLRSSRISVWMSGGIDSTSITAVARQVLSESTVPFELSAHTIVYDSLIPDRERGYASVAAQSLGIENRVFRADSYRPFDGWTDARMFVPEPTGDPFLYMRARQLSDVAAHSRVLLSGEGGDEVLWPSDAIGVARHTKATEFAASLARTFFVHRRRPPVGLRGALNRRRGKSPAAPPYPRWMNPILTDRLRLRERWEHVHSIEAPAIHALRPEAHRRLSSAPWAWYFETSDPGVTRIPVEIRYPFLDLRLVNYLLSIPPIPWCIDKEILRVAMHGALPDAVRLRPKAPLGGDPLEAGLRGSHGVPLLSGMPEVAAYVNPDAAPIPMSGYKGDDPWLDVRPLCLSYWLAHARADMSR